MEFLDLVKSSRTVRRFRQDRDVDMATLEHLVELARYTPSAGNLQPLKFALSCDPEMNQRIFPCLAWAAYLKDWPGPAAGERPSAYVVVLQDEEIVSKVDCDHGIVAQTMALGAREKGLGTCILASVDRRRLAKELGLPEHLRVKLVLALGQPAEDVEVRDMEPGGSVRYFREGPLHVVPKRTPGELIVTTSCPGPKPLERADGKSAPADDASGNQK